METFYYMQSITHNFFISSLMEEDESQLYLRVLAILREYCIFAQWNYSKQNGNQAITSKFS